MKLNSGIVDMRIKTIPLTIIVLSVALILAGCSVNYAPSGYLLPAAGAQREAYGAGSMWIPLHHLAQKTSGGIHHHAGRGGLRSDP